MQVNLIGIFTSFYLRMNFIGNKLLKKIIFLSLIDNILNETKNEKFVNLRRLDLPDATLIIIFFGIIIGLFLISTITLIVINFHFSERGKSLKIPVIKGVSKEEKDLRNDLSKYGFDHFKSIINEKYIAINYSKEIEIHGKICMLCTDQFMPNKGKVILLGCLHIFHRKCFKKHLISTVDINKEILPQLVCPICSQHIFLDIEKINYILENREEFYSKIAKLNLHQKEQILNEINNFYNEKSLSDDEHKKDDLTLPDENQEERIGRRYSKKKIQKDINEMGINLDENTIKRYRKKSIFEKNEEIDKQIEIIEKKDNSFHSSFASKTENNNSQVISDNNKDKQKNNVKNDKEMVLQNNICKIEIKENSKNINENNNNNIFNHNKDSSHVLIQNNIIVMDKENQKKENNSKNGGKYLSKVINLFTNKSEKDKQNKTIKTSEKNNAPYLPENIVNNEDLSNKIKIRLRGSRIQDKTIGTKTNVSERKTFINMSPSLKNEV